MTILHHSTSSASAEPDHSTPDNKGNAEKIQPMAYVLDEEKGTSTPVEAYGKEDLHRGLKARHITMIGKSQSLFVLIHN